MASRPVELRLEYGDAAPGSTALAGEGVVGTTLPGNGQLTLRVPHTVGQAPALGDAQLAASYDLAPQLELLPKLAVVALVNLPANPDARAAPGLRASAGKQLGAWFVHSIHFETELRTEGPELARSTRIAIGASFLLPAATTGTLELVSYRRGSGSPAPREDLAELALVHALRPDASLRMGLGGALTGSAASLRATLGLDLRF